MQALSCTMKLLRENRENDTHERRRERERKLVDSQRTGVMWKSDSLCISCLPRSCTSRTVCFINNIIQSCAFSSHICYS